MFDYMLGVSSVVLLLSILVVSPYVNMRLGSGWSIAFILSLVGVVRTVWLLMGAG